VGPRAKILLAALCLVSSESGSAIAAYPTPPGCTQVHEPTGPTFFFDPINGRDTNTGSADSPLKNLQDALSSRRFPPNSLVYLRTGNYGAIYIKEYPNKDFIHIKAEPGHVPIFENIDLRSTSHWLFEGLQISRISHHLVRVYDNASNIVLSANEIFSTRRPDGWSARDWSSKASTAILMEGACGTVVNNIIKNVYHGIEMTANDGMAAGNRISFFAGDGMRANGSRLTLRQNRITDNLVVDGNHADGIQSFNIGGPGFADQTLDGNIIIQTTTKDKPFDDFLQGIGFFDGPYTRLRIINNVIILPSYHGITVYDAHDSWIVNNTVTGGSLPWIMVTNSNERPASSNVIVRNNLSSRIDLVPGAQGDHNLLLGKDPSIHFIAYDVANMVFDLRLKPTSRAIGAGSPKLAPPVDVEGNHRMVPIDIGAYQRHRMDQTGRR
jgi:Right handed beta helix region